MIKLTQITGEEIELNETDLVKAHFEEPRNYAYFILDEWKAQPYKDFIKKDSIILDIGANVGLFALHVLPIAKRIVCVEPTESHNNVFKDLINDERVELESSALHDYTGKVGFHIEHVNYTMNRVNNYHAGAIEVPCITLKDLCTKYNLNKVDFCKIDIEGSEDLAITEQTVKEVSNIIKAFSIELHPRTREMQDQYKSIFEKCGYKASYVDFNGTVYATK